ncbi:MAG: type II toxin-antitoxin system mRNA interferase toxin, RelE/StbE family [Bacteriovoracaceae bacterium]
MWTIEISKSANKLLRKAPVEIRDSFDAWKNIIQFQGITGLKAINDYRDHALKGDWDGARSSSLNSQWRVIYLVMDKEVKIFILEVTPHDYRKKL